MRHDPFVTIKEPGRIVGLSESGVKKVIRQLRSERLIMRVGGAKGGHWSVSANVDEK